MTWRTTNRKDRLRKAGVSGWEEQRQARRILERDGRTCYRCGQRATEVDHIRPLSKDGTRADENLAAICVPCHRVKTRAETIASQPPPRRRPLEPHPGKVG